MSKLYFYSLASKKELKELKEVGKDWEDVSIISLILDDVEKMEPDILKQLGEDIVAELIKHNKK